MIWYDFKICKMLSIYIRNMYQIHYSSAVGQFLDCLYLYIGYCAILICHWIMLRYIIVIRNDSHVKFDA